MDRQWLYEEYLKWRYVFLVSFGLNLAAYIGYIVHVTYAVDDYGAIFCTSKTIVSGRWVIDFIHDIVCQKNLIPTIVPLICMVLYILTGIGLCKLWKIKKNSLAVLIVSLFSTYPYLLDVYNVRFAALSLALAFFIVIIAVSFSTIGFASSVFSIILFYLSLSTYQPVLGFAIAAIMVQLLLIAIRENFSIESIRRCLRLLARYMAVLIVSVVVYLILTKLIFILFDVPVNSRIQEGFISN
ncbi:glucosyltransferase domain-containing protein, partial [bacterium]|nr:glucosyltransferase domain-containing protein [bacterium]